ncbi:MAG: NfeD family protein [Desulfonatronovibrionaceae bacterium]
MKKTILIWSLLFLSFASAGPVFAQKITAVDLEGPVTPVQAEILETALKQARDEGAVFFLIRLDTPGGTLSSTREMVKQLLNSRIPVGIWVGPSGARAASAGVFLVAASDAAAMAPNTTIGSASPVDASGEDAGETMHKKVVSELSSLLRSLGRDKKRNIDWYEQSVTQSANLNAGEAVLQDVVEYVAKDEIDFLQQLDSSEAFKTGGGPLSLGMAEISRFEPSFKQNILSWLVSPQIAYLLFLAGILGFFFELSSPGAIFPGAFGAICLILALYAFSTLPVTAAGILLILAGFVFFLLEIKIVSYGLLGLGAAGSIFLGSIMLFDPQATGLKLPMRLIIPAVGTVAAFFLIILYLVGKSQLSSWKQERQMVGMTGEIISWKKNAGKIKIRGEIWNCHGLDPDQEFSPGDTARVESISGLNLGVKPAQE